ncbi:hypothetical protein GOB93_09310 [Acetobacter musti]|uniref:Carbohydrate kinase PfkB domain-containing protein n=1 Tax=Acetobacter musti TaxID=864732 RepID=A0ABX0JN59_9PROT|nr:hypothetical protein [Acetobacter musti]
MLKAGRYGNTGAGRSVSVTGWGSRGNPGAVNAGYCVFFPIFADCNLPGDTLKWLLHQRLTGKFSLAVNTVSRSKARRLRGLLHGVDLLFTNSAEAAALLPDETEIPDERICKALLSAGAGGVICTQGGDGLLLAQPGYLQFLPAPRAVVVDVTGAGDALVGGTLSALPEGNSLMDACRFGMVVAALTVESNDSVSSLLTRTLVQENMRRYVN